MQNPSLRRLYLSPSNVGFGQRCISIVYSFWSRISLSLARSPVPYRSLSQRHSNMSQESRRTRLRRGVYNFFHKGRESSAASTISSNTLVSTTEHRAVQIQVHDSSGGLAEVTEQSTEVSKRNEPNHPQSSLHVPSTPNQETTVSRRSSTSFVTNQLNTQNE